MDEWVDIFMSTCWKEILWLLCCQGPFLIPCFPKENYVIEFAAHNLFCEAVHDFPVQSWTHARLLADLLVCPARHSFKKELNHDFVIFHWKVICCFNNCHCMTSYLSIAPPPHHPLFSIPAMLTLLLATSACWVLELPICMREGSERHAHTNYAHTQRHNLYWKCSVMVDSLQLCWIYSDKNMSGCGSAAANPNCGILSGT